MADYSHLHKASLQAFAERIDKGWRAHDEYLFEAVGFISPPLLDKTYMEALRLYFWPGIRTRGRPRKAPIDRLELARMVKATRHRGPAAAAARGPSCGLSQKAGRRAGRCGRGAARPCRLHRPELHGGLARQEPAPAGQQARRQFRLRVRPECPLRSGAGLAPGLQQERQPTCSRCQASNSA